MVPVLSEQAWVTSDPSRLGTIRTYDAHGLLGGLATLHAGLALGHNAELEYVHADRHRRGCRLCI